MCYIDWIFHYVMGYKNNEIQYMGMHNVIRGYCFIYDDIQYYQIKTYSVEIRCNSMKLLNFIFAIHFYKIIIVEIYKIIDNWVTQYMFKPPSLAVNVCLVHYQNKINTGRRVEMGDCVSRLISIFDTCCTLFPVYHPSYLINLL